ncbi:BQ2448_5973 [Microbotryum intermedium]|uniref:BQ2448_5973 protein n=1 Tax=Microbotryum intermedium TaxID=269621 RepID=A0A238F2Q1_9BASI|nr:BQ2448_5973 [Microbotryum intermedium]
MLDEPSTTQSTTAPHSDRRRPHPRKGSDDELIKLSGDKPTASAGELDNESDTRGAGQMPLSVLRLKKGKSLPAIKSRLSRDPASVSATATIQGKKEHMLITALAAMEQRTEDFIGRIMGQLNDSYYDD